MGRNDLCFCGSQKKAKRCHPDINEQSRAAKVIRLYNTIDTMIDNHYRKTGFKKPCSKGCPGCCHGDFPVSTIEFDIITREIRGWDYDKKHHFIKICEKLWNDIDRQYHEYTEVLEKDATRQKDVFLKSLSYDPDPKDIPCPFLNDDNSCMVYSVRPVICRTHGVAFIDSMSKDHELCSLIGSSNLAKEWQADLTQIADIFDLNNIPIPNSDKSILLRSFPIFYFAHKRSHLYIQQSDPILMELALHATENQYIAYLLSKYA